MADSAFKVKNGLVSEEVQIGVSGSGEIDTLSGNLTIDSAGGTVTVDDNLVVSGNLTVNGTTTTVNTATLNVSDNIVVLNNDVTGSPTENAGIEIERGTSTNVLIRWNETNDNWELTNNGSTYSPIATEDYVANNSATTLDGLSDVVVSQASDGEVLKYSAVTGWVNGSIELNDLSNVNYQQASSDDVLKWDGSAWVAGEISLDKLSDVTIQQASSGAVLQYNGQGWAAQQLSIPASLDELSDVTLGQQVADGDVLKYDQTVGWVNGPLSTFATNITLQGGIVSDQSATTISTTSATDISYFSKTEFRSGTFHVVITQGSKYTSMKVDVLHDGTTSYKTQYAVLEIGSPVIPVTISTAISGGSVYLRAAISDANLASASVKVFSILTKI